MSKKREKDKCVCGSTLTIFEEGKSFYCSSCRKYYVNHDFNKSQDAERKLKHKNMSEEEWVRQQKKEARKEANKSDRSLEGWDKIIRGK